MKSKQSYRCQPNNGQNLQNWEGSLCSSAPSTFRYFQACKYTLCSATRIRSSLIKRFAAGQYQTFVFASPASWAYISFRYTESIQRSFTTAILYLCVALQWYQVSGYATATSQSSRSQAISCIEDLRVVRHDFHNWGEASQLHQALSGSSVLKDSRLWNLMRSHKYMGACNVRWWTSHMMLFEVTTDSTFRRPTVKAHRGILFNLTYNAHGPARRASHERYFATRWVCA